MKRFLTILLIICFIGLLGCDDSDHEKPQGPLTGVDVGLSLVATGLNFPTSVKYISNTDAIGVGNCSVLPTGNLIITNAGRVGDYANSVISLNPNSGSFSIFSDYTRVDLKGQQAIDQPIGVVFPKGEVWVANIANGKGSVAVLDPNTCAEPRGPYNVAGEPINGPFDEGIFDVTDFAFTHVWISPDAGQQGVSIYSDVNVYFSRSVDPNTITSNTFEVEVKTSVLSPDPPDPPLEFYFSSDYRLVSAKPMVRLYDRTTYQVTLNDDIKDIYGFEYDGFLENVDQGMYWYFDTRYDVETTPLQVESVYPASGATEVYTCASVSATFNFPINTGTINSGSFYLQEVTTSNLIPGTYTFNGDQTVVTLNPDNDLDINTNYSLIINSNVKSIGGLSLQTDFNSTFTTGSSMIVAPVVVNTDPINDSDCSDAIASISGPYTIEFNVPMNPSTMSSPNIQLLDSITFANMNCTISYDPASYTAQIVPSPALQLDHCYIIRVNAGVENVCNMPLSSVTEVYFRTRTTTVVINEVCTDPKVDWSDSEGGDGIPFNNIPGLGSPTTSDEWVEIYNPTNEIKNMTGWRLVMTDSTPEEYVLSGNPTYEFYSAGSSVGNFQPGGFLVIGNPTGLMNNDAYLELIDNNNNLVDQVCFSSSYCPYSNVAPDTDADNSCNETVFRSPNGYDTDNDSVDWAKGEEDTPCYPATIGNVNTTVNTYQSSSVSSINNDGLNALNTNDGIGGICYAGPAPDEPGYFSELYFVTFTNYGAVMAIDYDDGLEYITHDISQPKALTFIPEKDGDGNVIPGTGELFVLSGSSNVVYKIEIERSGPVGAPGTKAKLKYESGTEIIGITHPNIYKPSDIVYNERTDHLFIANRGTGKILELTRKGKAVELYNTGLGADSISGMDIIDHGDYLEFIIADTGGYSSTDYSGQTGRVFKFIVSK